jgi:PTS system cellobiose-specific IIB component
MKNILLVCAAGMSTSMLVKRMQEHAAALRLGKYQCAGHF